MYSRRPLHTDEQRLDDQLEPINSSSVSIQNVARKTSWKLWTIETSGERGSVKSMLAAWHDDEVCEVCVLDSWNIFSSKTDKEVVNCNWFFNRFSYLMIYFRLHLRVFATVIWIFTIQLRANECFFFFFLFLFVCLFVCFVWLNLRMWCQIQNLWRIFWVVDFFLFI